MRVGPAKSRFLISSPESALRMNRCTALIELRLPVGFHALPVERQRAELERAAGHAVADAIERLDAARLAGAAA